jgi:Zn finger protein HypA/HybF involved in hydrogenase expression
MTFEDAVWIGLGLHIDETGQVLTKKLETRLYCSYCRHEYVPQNWQDEGSCPRCYSSNIYQVKAK